MATKTPAWTPRGEPPRRPGCSAMARTLAQGRLQVQRRTVFKSWGKAAHGRRDFMAAIGSPCYGGGWNEGRARRRVWF